MTQFITIAAGERFGRFVTLESGVRSHDKVGCVCDCGNRRSVPARRLRSGISQSCGCLRGEQLAARCTTHGMTGTKVFSVWQGVLSRCTNPANIGWTYYGGRGITVCEGWRDFATFYADMGDVPPGKSIDRIDVDGGYWCGHCEECTRLGRPANCQWATDEEQAANRRPVPLSAEVPPVQARALRAIAKAGGLTRAGVASAAGSSQGSAWAALQGLLRRGLVREGGRPRARCWHLTDAGRTELACSGWLDDVNGNVICATCLEAVPVPEAGAA